MNVQFRAATPIDWAAIAQFIVALYQEDPTNRPVTQANAELTFQESVTHPEKIRIIAFAVEAAIVGYAILVFYWSNELGGNVVFIDELFVQASHRGFGIATQFFSWLEQEFALSAQAFFLETTPANTRANAFYRKLGFSAYKNQHLIKLPG